MKKSARAVMFTRGDNTMSPIREQLVGVIDCLPETEQSLLLEIARRFLPDDVATPDDRNAIQTARTEYVENQTVSHESINWD